MASWAPAESPPQDCPGSGRQGGLLAWPEMRGGLKEQTDESEPVARRARAQEAPPTSRV